MQLVAMIRCAVYAESRKIVYFRKNGKMPLQVRSKNRKVHFPYLSIGCKRKTRPSRSPENRDGETFSSRFSPFAKDTETAAISQIPVVQRFLRTTKKPSLGRLNFD